MGAAWDALPGVSPSKFDGTVLPLAVIKSRVLFTKFSEKPVRGWDRITLLRNRAGEDVDETVERYTYPLKQRVRIFGGIVTRNVPEALAESTYCLTELEFRASL